MAHPFLFDIRRSHGDKLNAMTGQRGEHASERAERIADVKDAVDQTRPSRTHEAEEQFIESPNRQVSNMGRVIHGRDEIGKNKPPGKSRTERE